MNTQIDPDHPDVARLRKLAYRMDKAFRLPIVGVRVGWDSILGLVPGVGDVLTLLPAGYIIRESHRLGAPKSTLVKMGVNIGIDAAIGSIPLLGDIIDIGWKANTRNVNLLHQHLVRQTPITNDDIEGNLSSHHPTLAGRGD